MSAIVAAYIAAGGAVTLCRQGSARGRLVWRITSHPTRSLPLNLGAVGRW